MAKTIEVQPITRKQLGGVTVNESDATLIPSRTGLDLGSATRPWRKLFVEEAIAVSESATFETLTVTSTMTALRYVGRLTKALAFGSYLAASAASYNNSADVTVAVDATPLNTASKVVARDGSGNFAAGTITATLNGAAPAGSLSGTTLAATVTTSSLTTIGTLVAGAVPASLVTAGTFGAGDYVFPSDLTVTDTLKINGGVSGSSAQLQAVGGSNFRTYATQVNHLLGRANGALGSETVLVNNDAIGGLTWQGYDGTTVSTGATLLGIARGTWSGSSRPTAIRFATTASGSTTTTGRWDVDPSGHFIGVADNTYDIGASGATRPRTGYFGTSVVVGTDPGGSDPLRGTGNIFFVGSNHQAQLRSTAASSSSGGASYQMYVADGAAMASGDRLGSITFGGGRNASNTLGNGVVLSAYADDNWSDTSTPGRLDVRITATGSTSLTAVWRWSNGGGYGPVTDNAVPFGSSSARPTTVYGYTGDFKTTVGVGIGLTTDNLNATITVNAGTNAGANDKDAYYGVQRGGTALWRMGVLGSVSADANWTLRDVVNGSSAIVITPSTLAAVFGGSIKTATPSGGTAAAWKFGSRVAATVALDTTQYIELDVGGTLYKVGIVT